MNAICAENLTKLYKSKNGNKLALDSINMTIPEGSFFGLLGPNGAGKSTFINILAGLVNKTSGAVTICGYDIDKDIISAKQSIGIVPQELVLDPFFTVTEALEYHAGYYGVRKAERRTSEIISAMGLKDKANSNSRQLSGGMRRRLLIGKALVHSPKVLVLDEPTAGVDIELRFQLWEYIKRLNKEGTTIILTTHYIEEAQELCDEIAVINHGKIITQDSKSNLMKKIDCKSVTFDVEGHLMELPQSLRELGFVLEEGNKLSITYKANEYIFEDIMSKLRAEGVRVKDAISQEVKLEKVFRNLVYSDN